MKQPISFPGGDNTRRPATRAPLSFGGGDRVKQASLKPSIQLPETQIRAFGADKILGVHDNMAATTRPLGLLSSVSNLKRAEETAMKTRTGRVALGSSLGGPITGLFAAYASRGVDYLLAGVGGSVYAYNADFGTWNSKGSFSTSGQWYATMFGDSVILANGIDRMQRYGLPSPQAPALTAAVPTVATSVSGGTKYFVLTYVDSGGEHLPGGESSIKVASGDEITVTSPTWPNGVIYAKIYGGTSSGGPYFFADLILSNGGSVTLTSDPAGSAAPSSDSNHVMVNLGGNAPKGKFVCTAYRTLFTAGVIGQENLLYFSDTNNAERWVFSVNEDGVPDSGDSGAIPVDDFDGDQITWLRVYRSNLCIWKKNSLHELHGPEVGQLSQNWRVMHVDRYGTPSGRTIQEVDGVLYWLSFAGVVAWNGGKPQIISDPVKGILDSVDWDLSLNFNAGTDGECYYLTVMTDANTYKTLVFRPRDGSWWVWSDWQPRMWVNYTLDGANLENLIYGDYNGRVYMVGGTTDTTTITWEAIFGPSTFGLTMRNKILRRFYVVASLEGLATLKAAVAPDSSGATWETEVTLSGGSQPLSYGSGTGKTRRVKRYIPLANTESAEVFTPRLRLSGTGVATIYDVGIEYTEVD